MNEIVLSCPCSLKSENWIMRMKQFESHGLLPEDPYLGHSFIYFIAGIHTNKPTGSVQFPSFRSGTVKNCTQCSSPKSWFVTNPSGIPHNAATLHDEYELSLGFEPFPPVFTLRGTTIRFFFLELFLVS